MRDIASRAALNRRGVLAAGLGAALFATASAAPAQARFQAAVRTSAPGAREFPTLTAALAAAAETSARPFRVLLGEGVFEEKPTIASPDIHLFGQGRGRTVLSFGAASGHPRPDGSGNWGTSGSATLTVTAPGFRAERMSINNSFDYLEDLRTQASGGAQAVALNLSRESDRAVLSDVELMGYQDTLLTHAGRTVFRGCRIGGAVDFIFGGGVALFDRCEILTRATPGRAEGGYIAAPSTPNAQRYGLVFDRCRLTREPGVRDHSIFLGRPWRAGGNPDLRGAATFLRCWMDAHVAPAGWTSMGFRAPDGFRLMLAPEEARFGEYDSRGPGARPGPLRRRLTAAEARAYAPERVLDGWRP